MGSIFLQYWDQILVVVGFIVWLVRLEASMNEARRKHTALEKRQMKLEDKQDKTLTYLQVELSVVKQSLAKIEGWLAGANKDLIKK